MSAEDSVRIIESALAVIIAWATRRDIYEETTRRARCNLPRGHTGLLSRLATAGPLRVGELAELLGVDNSTITPMTQRLEGMRLIAREPDPEDGRAAVLRITPAGKRNLNRLQSRWGQ